MELPDLSYLVAISVAVGAIVSPIFTAIVNNLHQRKMRKIEIEYQLKLKMYEDKKTAFCEFLESFGDYLQYGNKEKDFGGKMANVCLYLPSEMQEKIRKFYNSIDSTNRQRNYCDFLMIAELLACQLGSPPPLKSQKSSRPNKR